MLAQRNFFACIAISACIIFGVNCSIEEEEHGVIYANRCEACKILATELTDRLKETGKSREIIDLGYLFNIFLSHPLFHHFTIPNANISFVLKSHFLL